MRSKEEQERSRSNQQWKVDKGMLIPWMNAVKSKIARGEVVCEIVEWSDCGMGEQIGPVN